jgi:hypothetical protein
MIATLPDGTKERFRVGANLHGRAFTAVEFTAADFQEARTDHFRDWFFETVVPRMVPLGVVAKGAR